MTLLLSSPSDRLLLSSFDTLFFQINNHLHSYDPSSQLLLFDFLDIFSHFSYYPDFKNFLQTYINRFKFTDSYNELPFLWFTISLYILFSIVFVSSINLVIKYFTIFI